MSWLLRAIIVFVVPALTVSAALLSTAPSSGTITTFPGGTTCVQLPGTATVAGFDISFDGEVCYDYNNGWGIGSNGSWPTLSLIGDNSTTTAITIDLGGLYSSVVGFMNYSPTDGTPVIAAIAADGTTVLESYDIAALAPISTPGGTDQGAYRGIVRPTADIRYFRFGGAFTAFHDLTLDGGAASVPEPSAWLLALPALLAFRLARRRRP
jgi:MYXO-CTERM domain-containing protein